MRNNGHSIGPAATCAMAMMRVLIDTSDPRRIDERCADDLPPPDFSAD